MSRFRLLFDRFIERRFLRDGAADASLLPGALTTLAASTLLASLVLGELPFDEIALLAVLAVFAWSLLRGVLDERELEDDSLDDRVLAPLPVKPSEVLAARVAVVSIGIVVDALNVALPPAVMIAVSGSPGIGLVLVLGAVLSAAFGLALSLWIRRGLALVFSRDALAEWEGPIQLAAALGAFALVVVLPERTDGGLGSLLQPPWRLLPPIAFAAPLGPDLSFPDVAAFCLGAALTAMLLLLSVKTASSRRASSTATTRRRSSRVVAAFAGRIHDDEERAGFIFAAAAIRGDRVFRRRALPLFLFPFAAVVVAGIDASDRTLVPMAFFGATVYLVLAEVFLAFSESASGPPLLASLPIASEARFRLGAEQAFLVRLVVPIHLLLALGTGLLDVAGGRFSAISGHLALGLLSLLASVIVVLITFERLPVLPFSIPDRALFPVDVSGGAFLALLLATVAALATAPALSRPWLLALEAACLLIIIRSIIVWKRRRCSATAPRI